MFYFHEIHIIYDHKIKEMKNGRFETIAEFIPKQYINITAIPEKDENFSHFVHRISDELCNQLTKAWNEQNEDL